MSVHHLKDCDQGIGMTWNVGDFMQEPSLPVRAVTYPEQKPGDPASQ